MGKRPPHPPQNLLNKGQGAPPERARNFPAPVARTRTKFPGAGYQNAHETSRRRLPECARNFPASVAGTRTKLPGAGCRNAHETSRRWSPESFCGAPCGAADGLIRYFGCTRPSFRRQLPESFCGSLRGGFFQKAPSCAPADSPHRKAPGIARRFLSFSGGVAKTR